MSWGISRQGALPRTPRLGYLKIRCRKAASTDASDIYWRQSLIKAGRVPSGISSLNLYINLAFDETDAIARFTAWVSAAGECRLRQAETRD